MEVFKNIATVVGCLSACIALLATIIKPFRQWLINYFIKKAKDTKRDEKIDKMDKKIDKLLKNNKYLDNILTRV